MIGLLGFGKSNQILYKFLKGKKLFVSEISSLPKKWKKIFIDDGTEFEENGHSEKLLKCDLIIKSPGAKRNLPILKAAEKKGIEIINEMEYTYRVLRTLHMVPKIVVITGTNGKTTTTSLIGEMLKQNYEVFVGGNIGNPFCEILNVPKKPQIAVLEISSFQALDLKDFKIALKEINRVTSSYAIISLPYSGFCFSGYWKFPFSKGKVFRIPSLIYRPKFLKKKLDIEHYWALGEILSSVRTIRRMIKKVDLE